MQRFYFINYMTVDMKEVVHLKAVAPLAVEYKKAEAEMKAAVHKIVVVHMAAVVKTYGYSR